MHIENRFLPYGAGGGRKDHFLFYILKPSLSGSLFYQHYFRKDSQKASQRKIEENTRKFLDIFADNDLKNTEGTSSSIQVDR